MVTTATPEPGRPNALRAVLHLRREEILPAGIAALLFFLVLTSLTMLRPARDAMGMQGGIGSLLWLVLGTAVVALVLNPLLGLLVSRMRRLVFVRAIYGGLALSLVAFWGPLALAPASLGGLGGRRSTSGTASSTCSSPRCSGRWWPSTSAWIRASDCSHLFRSAARSGRSSGPGLPRGSRGAGDTWPPVGRGRLHAAGTTGGPAAHARGRRALAAPPTVGDGDATGRDAGSAWSGMGAVSRSPYLGGIAGYALLTSMVATFIYFTRLQMIAGLAEDVDACAAIPGTIDMWTQVTVLLLQLTLTGHMIGWFGLGFALVIQPTATAIGFAALAIQDSFAVLILLEATSSAVQRRITRPTREALYSAMGRKDQ